MSWIVRIVLVLLPFCHFPSSISALVQSGSRVKEPARIAELEQLTTSIAHKELGSRQYQKTWITWSTLVIEHIRYDLSKQLPHPEDVNSTQQLKHALAMVGDLGQIQTPDPSQLFAHAGARSGYTLDFFGRVRRLSDTILLSQPHDSDIVPRLRDSFHQVLSPKNRMDDKGANTNPQGNHMCHITSIGGGPGYDFVGLTLVASFLHGHNKLERNCGVRATVFDYETGWSEMVDSMHRSTDKILRQLPLKLDGHYCSFGGSCDITKPMDHPVNHAMKQAIWTSHVFVCQYCIAENALRLEESRFEFFRNLFDQANEGALFVFTEMTHRFWPALMDVLPGGGFDVALVKNRSFQILLQKRKGAILSSEVHQQCLLIEQQFKLHKVKRNKGFVRQQKLCR